MTGICIRLLAVAAIALFAGQFLIGCARPRILAQALTPSYVPSNVFKDGTVIPAQIRRVAVLPLSVMNEEDGDMAFGRDTLMPVLVGELNRARVFEVVTVTVDELRLISGKGVWNAEEKLPLEFFDRIKEKFGADAVLFSRLTMYRAYEPLAIGWRIKLIDADEPHILWAVDEVFDARDPSVAAAAVKHAQNTPDTASSLADSRSVLQSPRRFGRYTAQAVIGTMPGRAVASKE